VGQIKLPKWANFSCQKQLAGGMEKLTSYLFGMGESFHEAIQVKCEMEDEARSEYARYMEVYDGQ